MYTKTDDDQINLIIFVLST